MNAQTAKSYQAALDKASALGTAQRVRDLGNGRYELDSSDGKTTYQIEVVAGGKDFICSCPAGVNGRCCYHCASVHIARMVASMVKVAPAPATKPLAVNTLPASRWDRHGLTPSQELWG